MESEVVVENIHTIHSIYMYTITYVKSVYYIAGVVLLVNG